MKKNYFNALILSLFLSFSVFAETPTTEVNTEVNEAVVTNGYEEKINAISQEIVNFEQLQNGASEQDRMAFQLYTFRKNVELRKVISEAINDTTIDKAFLIEQVQKQQSYAEERIKLLTTRVSDVATALNDAADDEKLTILTQYKEVRDFLDGTYQETAENITWLNKLEVDTQAEQESFYQDVSVRLEQIAADIEFLKQRRENQNIQLQDSPEAKKEGISLLLNVTRRQIDIATDSLQIMIKLADDIGIDTAKYKRLNFDVTGSVTQDLFNKDVLGAILIDWSEKLWDWAIGNAPQVFFQLLVIFIILFATMQVAKMVRKVLGKMVSNKNLNLSQLMQDFFIAMSGRIVWVIGFLIVLSQIGINLGPVLAGFGIAGVVIGLALQDTLSNFASGMMLLIYRPFDVGDFVYAGGVDGKVSHMSLVNTTIKTFDNQIIIVPNSRIWGDVIKNVTSERVRRVDMVFGVSYNDDVEFVEKIFLDIITNHPAVLKSPEPMIKVGSLGDSSVNFLVRPWSRTEDYWDVYWDVTREVKIRFDKEGISIPFPQQDVHLYHGVEKALYGKKPDTTPDNTIVKQ